MITLNWAPIIGSDVASYRIYRSIIGFVAPLTPAAAGQTITLKIDGGSPQIITLGVDNVASINTQLTGGRAYPSLNDPTQFLVRTNNRISGSVEIVDGAALGISNRIITSQSETTLVATVAALPDQTQTLCYVDQDGTPDDWYAISTVDSSSAESDRTVLAHPQTPNGRLCTIEGIVVDSQGNPVVDSPVTATLVSTPDRLNAKTFPTNKPVSTLTHPDGSFSITLLQGGIFRFQVPDVEFDENVLIPCQSFAVWGQLLENTDWRPELGVRNR